MSAFAHRAAIRMMLARYTRGGAEPWPETEALIEHAPEHFGPYLQRMLDVGPYMHNRVECTICNEVVESKNRHKFATCSCGAVSVDGGTWHLGRSAYALDGYEDLSEKWPWIEEE